MGSFIEAGKTGEFKDGMKKKVMVGGREIMLARVGDKYYAVDNRCPHMGGELSAGQLQGTVVTCPRHSSQFDITDGHNVRWLKGSGLFSAVGKVLKSPRPLPTYNVRVDGDTILIEV
ncbi:MAG TPA: Rieske 2Fe-2S domain-containing protein [Dehalococcoidales bacterium]|nr:Rieske 2Fe-2S domain-containing protein [Dehalococcoidales bacterium]